MTERSGTTSPSAQASAARHANPLIDDLGLAAARHADRLLAEAQARGVTRWATYLEPLPDRLRDDGLPGLRAAALRARAAYGPKDSVRDALPQELTEPFLDSIDRLLREINRLRA
jgi:cytosine/adenosine deaminase-related metal-dependent hydrolase